MTPADREKLVEAYGDARERYFAVLRSGNSTRDQAIDFLESQHAKARAALLAAMEPVGEVYEVTLVLRCHIASFHEPGVMLQGYTPGDRVRVTKVEAK